MIQIKVKKASIYVLLLIFLISFFIRLMPLFKGYNVPFGVVDTSFHISSALDLSEGNFKSLTHPWWHLKNHILINGFDIVDRNSASFFYPPFLHIILAFSFLFLHPGIASIIIISLLYSLSVISIFFLCKSFNFKDGAALISAALIAVSVPLLYSQNYGFWTFTIALNFMILSYSFLRFKSRKFTRLSILFYFLALITHWAFFIFAIIIALIEIFNKNKEAILYILSILIITLPFYLYIFYLANPFSYIATHFNIFIFPNFLLTLLAIIGFIFNFKKYRAITIFFSGALALTFLYYTLKIKFIFGDMVQFVYPFLISFYIGGLFQSVNKKKYKILLTIGIFVILAINLLTIQKVLSFAKASIEPKEFNDLLQLRNNFEPNDKTIIAIDRGLVPWWLTIVSKGSKIVYPATYENENIKEYYENYIFNKKNMSSDYTFYRITKKDSTLILENNVTLLKNPYRFGN